MDNIQRKIYLAKIKITFFRGVCINKHTENLYCHEQHKTIIVLQIRMETGIFSIVQGMVLMLVHRPIQEVTDIKDI